jgi:PEGA domain-containing protein
MKRDPRVQYSKITAEIKLDVTPKEAGVFLDGAFVGNLHEFGGVGRAMLVNPGKHELKLVLPGYQDFVTEVDLLPRQKFTIATKLIPGTSSTQPGAPPKQE